MRGYTFGMLKVYKPDKKDYKTIADIYNKAHKSFLDIYSEEERKALVGDETETEEGVALTAKTREFLCVKEDDEKVLAYSSFRLKNNQTVWVSSLYVSLEHQGGGIGKLLLDAMENWAIKQGAKVIVLETHKKADWAINFYKKHNYEIINDKLKEYPFDKVLDKDPVPGRPILGKVI